MSDDNVRLGDLFDEYEKTSAITVLETGKHTLKVTSCTVRNKGVCPIYSPVTGPQAGLRVMAGGIYPGDSEGGRNAFFRKLEKFGLTKEFFKQGPTLSDVAKSLVGRVVELDLTVGDWNGEPRNDMSFAIKLISAPDAPSVGGIPNVPTPSAPPVVSAPAPVVPSAPATEQTQTTIVDDEPAF